jgi:hypothetical protein
MRTTTERDQHFDGLQKSGKTIALSGFGADRAFLFTIIRVAHHAFPQILSWFAMERTTSLNESYRSFLIMGALFQDRNRIIQRQTGNYYSPPILSR